MLMKGVSVLATPLAEYILSQRIANQGLYSLILRSRKAKAMAFMKWAIPRCCPASARSSS